MEYAFTKLSKIFINIHLAQLSNLIGPFVPRDRPVKTILDGPPGNHRNNVKIAILDVRLTQIRVK